MSFVNTAKIIMILKSLEEVQQRLQELEASLDTLSTEVRGRGNKPSKETHKAATEEVKGE